MYARVASFEGGDLERLREENQRRMEAGETPEEMKGVLVLADAERNRRLFITLFDSREAIEATEPRFEQMGDEIPEEIRGRRTSVDYYEVVFQRISEVV